MKIDELIKLCKEYDYNTLDINTLEKNVEAFKQDSNLEWCAERDQKKLLKKAERQKEIKNIFVKINNIEL